MRQAVVVFMPRQACLSGSIKQQASPDGESCYPVQGPARRGRRGMHSPQGEHNPLVAAGQKTVFFPLAEEAAILCKGPPGEGVGECTARRASTIPWLQPGKKQFSFRLRKRLLSCARARPARALGMSEQSDEIPFWPVKQGIGEYTARRASTIPRVTAGCQNCPPRNHSWESHKNKKAAAKNGCLFCRGTPTRTEDPLLPKQIR